MEGEYVSKSLEDTRDIALNLSKSLKPRESGALVIGLYGELGAGKTTFMKYFAQALGVREEIQSPTFVIMKRFEIEDLGFKNLIHIDAYRIESGDEMINLGWEDIIKDGGNLICVEWPERIEGVMPNHHRIIFQHLSENERKIILE